MKRCQFPISRGIALAFAVAASCLLEMESAQADETPVSVADLISRLTDPSFKQREIATAELRLRVQESPNSTEKALALAYLNATDPEQKFRSRELLMEGYVNAIGFLGIRYISTRTKTSAEKSIYAIRVSEVVEETPAREAGILAGDLILAIDGKLLDPKNPEPDFSDRIRNTRPGQKVTLTMNRNEEQIEIKVLIGTSPMVPTPAEAEQLFEQRLSKFLPLAEKKAAQK